MDTRTLKTVGSLPVFPKSYYSSAVQGTRRGMIYGLRGAEKLGAARLVRNIAIPDLARSRSASRTCAW